MTHKLVLFGNFLGQLLQTKKLLQTKLQLLVIIVVVY